MTQNTLFPVFLKTEKLRFLIIGAGNVGLEKAQALLRQNPETSLKVVAKEIFPETRSFLAQFPQVTIFERDYLSADLEGVDLLITATNDAAQNKIIKDEANAAGVLVNAADQPDYCDFYLGSIVNKGSLKIAISTNGKSPTIAKRLREVFEENIPDEMDEVLENMQKLRSKLSGDFQKKVEILNKVTQDLSNDSVVLDDYLDYISQTNKFFGTVQAAKKKLNYYLLVIGGFVAVALSLFLLQYFNLLQEIPHLLSKDHHLFYWMILAGFGAEIVAGSMGMGYGVICTTILLSLGIAPPVVSASIHSAESFTSLAGTISHYKLKNIDKKLVLKLAIPALVGVLVGALSLSYLGEEYAVITKPIISLYTLYLGYNILKNAFVNKQNEPKLDLEGKINYNALGAVGGFIDSFTGGGWGPMVTGTLLRYGFPPRYVVGSSTAAKFILTVFSAVIFIFTIGIHHWNIVLGLLLGGIVTAPFSAMLTSKLPPKKMFLLVGSLVIALSLLSIYKAIVKFFIL